MALKQGICKGFFTTFYWTGEVDQCPDCSCGRAILPEAFRQDRKPTDAEAAAEQLRRRGRSD